jgi:hypothetical protein
MEKLLILGDGSLIKGILILPFAINGVILVIKGAIANLDKLDETRTVKTNWQAGAYFSVFILSYSALLYAVAKLL